MITVLLYIVVLGLVAGLLFLLASAVFGRGEELGPLPKGQTLTALPAEDIHGDDVRELKFAQAVRGYKASEVDWALERLAEEIDRLQALVAEGDEPTGGPGEQP